MTTWILIADAARARIFRWDELRCLRLIQLFDNPRGRARAQELVSDEPGRLDKGRGRNVISAMEPRTTPHEVEAEYFARRLADALHEGVLEHEADAIALIAPAHFLGLLRGALKPDVARAVTAQLPRDYSAIPEHDLPDHLAGLFDEIEKLAVAQ